MTAPSILIYGYGNPGRKDDGLGICFVEAMEVWANEKGLENLHFDVNYQLNPEDAMVVAPFEIVLFVDASVEDLDDFTIDRVKTSSEVSFTQHSVSPSYVMFLCQTICGKLPEAYLLHIKGYEWQMETALTERASGNLEKALSFVKEAIEEFSSQDEHAVINFQPH